MGVKVSAGPLYLQEYCTFEYTADTTRRKKNKEYLFTCRIQEFFWKFIIDKNLRFLSISRIAYGMEHPDKALTLGHVAWKKTATIFKKDTIGQDNLDMVSYVKAIDHNDLEEVHNLLSAHQKLSLHGYFSIQ